MGDDGVCRSDFGNFGKGRVTEGNVSNGDMDCLLVLAHSAELMSRCDGNFDSAIGINENDEDSISIEKCLDGIQSVRVSENDGFHSHGNDLTHLNQIQHPTVCDNDSLGKESNGEQFVESLPSKKVRLTQIKCQARSKHGLLEQQIVGECVGGFLRGKTIRLSQLRRLARTKDAGIWARKLGLANRQTSQDEQIEQSMGKRRASEDCVFSEVDTIHEYGSWDGDTYNAETPEESNSETQIIKGRLREPSAATQDVKFREQQQMDQLVPSLQRVMLSYVSNARAENDCNKCRKGSSRLINLKRKARLAKCLN